MSGAIAHDQAQRLREALEDALRRSGHEQDSTRDAFLRLVEVLETSPTAVVLPADDLLSTHEAAALLGVSRMTVVRLIERGKLTSQGGGVHRRIAASEVARYRDDAATRKRTALQGLADEIDQAPADQVIRTR